MNTKRLSWVVAIALLTGSVLTEAAFLFDTGGGNGITPGGATLNSVQGLAGRFTLAQATTITGLEGWIGRGEAGDLTYAIYTDGAGSLVPGTEVFSTSLAIVAHSTPGFSLDFAEWIGPTGLNLALNPGTYWVAFEVRDSSTFSGVMTEILTTPLPAYSNFLKPNIPNYQAFGSQIGVRISGDVAAIPEPATFGLVGVALAGLGLVVRRSRQG